jgi:hypothetical protein
MASLSDPFGTSEASSPIPNGRFWAARDVAPKKTLAEASERAKANARSIPEWREKPP